MSSSAWPVGTAISVWNGSPNVHLTWSPNGCPGYTGTHCVNVYSGNYGYIYAGKFTADYDSQSHYLRDGTNAVMLNDNFVSAYPTAARQLACHEIGLGHNSSPASCLYTGNTQPGWTPTDDDFQEIIRYVYPY
ncbi:hypothetical protein [Yinghuangia seranimata]|uniref:hypothetical protein n=1 Tax=Yinghuangia seranimata TaxID=408067 RepID=UPI00248C2960|nr:hypothetical protein [Yinghuangia seranimata]MDI2130517.1 hypothetical protein [Yinghuangia seranimata]